MRRLSTLVAVTAVTAVSLVALAGCGTAGGGGSGGASTTLGGCPPIPEVADAPMAAVDYIDFVQWRGIQYIAPPSGPRTAGAGDVGAEQFRVTCSYSELNERTGRQPPDPVDLSAAFLPAGTPVHALNGWAPECRLTAQRDGAWQVYVATVPGAQILTVDPCATAPSGSSTN